MEPDSFRTSTAGRVIRIGSGDAAYWAFLPNPLPPELPADWGLMRAISDADRAVSELAGLGRTLSNPNLYIRPFLRREAVLSSKIEGTLSDLTDLYLYEDGQIALPGMEPPPPTDNDAHEVYNYVRALETGLSQLNDLPVNIWMLRGLHKILLEGVRGQYSLPGKFRTRQNWIGGSTINDAIYVPPPVVEIEPSLHNLEGYFYLNDDYPPLVRLAFIHYQFEAIHPFVDGNGRIGRLLMSLLLVSWNLLPLPLLHLSAYIEANRQQYYQLLLDISQRGNWREWLLFFMQAVTAQAQDTSARIKRIQDLRQSWQRRLHEGKASASVLMLAEFLLENPIITVPKAQSVLQMTYHGAERPLNKLLQLGILSPTDGQHKKTYQANDVLDILHDH